MSRDFYTGVDDIRFGIGNIQFDLGNINDFHTRIDEFPWDARCTFPTT